jgi:predicted Zn-dependent protease
MSTLAYCVLGLVLLILCGACGGQAKRDQAAFEKDRVALTDVRRIGAGLAQSQAITQNDLDLLRKIHAKYPGANEVRQTLQVALQARQDWGALEKLLTEFPDAIRTQQEQSYLAMVYIKLGRYSDASHIAGPLAEGSPNDLELNSLAGTAWYYEGRYDDASRAFDRVWDALVASKQVDEIMMRGMIYFYRGDKGRAIEILKKTVEIKPDYVAGINALSRVYAAIGNNEQAELYRGQAERAHAIQTAEEARRMRVVSRSRDLESAFAAGRYDDSILIARELLQSASDLQKPTLYEFLGRSYQATGRQTEAQAAFAEAARLRQQIKS